MDLMTIVSLLSYGIMGIGGWLLKTLWTAVDNLRKDVAEVQKNLGTNYMPRQEIQVLVERILDEIRDFRKEIRDDLKHKVDR